MIWDKEKIKSILPQREPFLFIDEVIEIESNQKVIARKHIDPDEFFFNGHFPGNPVMPGVLLIEAMAQTSILVYYLCKPEIANAHPTYYLGKVKSEFLTPVLPNDDIIIEARNIKITDTAGVVNTIARVDGKTAAKAEFVFGIKKNE